MIAGTVVSVNLSSRKGVRKTPATQVLLKADFGIEGDAHASSNWHRQVSLLALESIEKMKLLGLDVSEGDFAENITTKGIELTGLPVGTKMKIGPALAQVTQIGKRCHTKCEIYRQAGDCIMPKEGIFVKVLSGGAVRKGDPIEIL
jgi:MOSC domain-containing protein YiiM